MKMTAMAEEAFVQPDKRLRRVVAGVAILLIVAGAVGAWQLSGLFEGIEELTDEELAALILQVEMLTKVAVWMAACGVVGCGWWLFWLGSKITRSGRYPPPGMKVIRTVRVRTGAAARRLANLAFLAAVVLTVAGTFGVWRLWQLATRVLQDLGGP